MVTQDQPNRKQKSPPDLYRAIASLTAEVKALRAELRVLARRMLTIPEAAHFLGISEKTLRNRTGKKAANPFEVRPKRVAGRVLFDLRDLEDFVDGLGVES
jgi:hypothetical protein